VKSQKSADVRGKTEKMKEENKGKYENCATEINFNTT
jgi:hypothetical protein